MPQEGSQSSFVENLMMSTAEIQYYDNGEKTPYSPRLQGAGLLNLKAASETPVKMCIRDRCRIICPPRAGCIFPLFITAPESEQGLLSWTARR